MTVSVVTSGQAYANNVGSLSSSAFDVAAGDCIRVTSWVDVAGAVVADSFGQTWDSTGVDIENDSGRVLRVAYILASAAHTGMTLSLTWGGANHYGGMDWEVLRTDAGSFAFDKTVGVAGTFNTNPVSIASFDTTGAGAVSLGAIDYYSDVSETLDVGAPFTRRSFTAGAAGVGAMSTFDSIATGAQTGLAPSCTASSPGGSLAIGFAGASFVVSGGEEPPPSSRAPRASRMIGLVQV